MSAPIIWTDEEEATPGPWGVHEGDDYICVIGPHDTTDAPVANVMWLADARLIAAAPDLLAALERAAARFEAYARLHNAKVPPDAEKAARNADFAADARAAVAKAKGHELPPLTGEMATRIARAGREGV